MKERRQDPFRVQQEPRLGNRLMRALVVSSGAALLIAGLIFDGFVYLSLRGAMVEDLTMQARIAADNTSAAVLFDDPLAAAQTLDALRASRAILHADLHDANGRVIARYGTPEEHAPLDAAAPISNESGHTVAGDRIYVTQLVQEAGRTVGSLHIVATLGPLYRRVAIHVAMTVFATGVAFAFAFVLAIRIRRDIDATEARLDYLAYYDAVTGLLNRRAANQQIQRLIDTMGHHEGFALVLVDLDDFKTVNDTLGHACGDELLRKFAARLKHHMRPADVAFRLGGDEFLILAPRLSGHGPLQALGQAAQQALEAPIAVAGHEIRVRASMGIAQFPRDAVDAASLVRAADIAMYDAKSQGKNTFTVFHPDMERDARQRMRLDADLRLALERDELHLVYQPIIDLKQRRMVGVEALLRWRHPELGLVMPGEFIALAERSGIIVDIGQWVLHTACRQVKAWADSGHPGFYVAVNVSARQIRRGLRGQIDSALASSGADPRSLEIEITEHSMVEDIQSNVAQLALLSALGVGVAVDDFGTGLSSLAYLKRLPINKLKIDRTFVKDVPSEGDDGAIALAIVSMSRSLGLTVVAEGVETEAQQDFFSRHGCDCAQGFLYSRPVEPEAIAELLQRHAAPGPVWPQPRQVARVPASSLESS
ncbi:putative signaling protein [Burkholderiaceae bacterium]|nr:putative signaling protein [Burkholderiaceae bacterium]